MPDPVPARTDDASGGAGHHDVGGRRPGLQVSTWVFLFIGCFVGVVSLIYLPAAEWAGQVMLGVTSLFGLWIGAFFWFRWRHVRRRSTEVAEPVPDADEHYLPHASLWPFGIGVATFLLANGLVLGTWFLVPGGLVLLLALLGFARQSRRRD